MDRAVFEWSLIDIPYIIFAIYAIIRVQGDPKKMSESQTGAGNLKIFEIFENFEI